MQNNYVRKFHTIWGTFYSARAPQLPNMQFLAPKILDKKWSAKVVIPEYDDQNVATESQSMFYPKWKVKPGKGKVASFSNVDEETTDQADTEFDEEDILKCLFAVGFFVIWD